APPPPAPPRPPLIYPTTASTLYDPAHKPSLANGERIKYFSTDAVGNAETVQTSPAAKVDKAAPTTSDSVDGDWHAADVDVTLSATDSAHVGTPVTYS